MTLTLALGGHTSDPTLGVGASSAAGRSFGSPTLPSTMQWTLVPPKPKLDMAARPPFQGVGWATTCNALETLSEHVLLIPQHQQLSWSLKVPGSSMGHGVQLVSKPKALIKGMHHWQDRDNIYDMCCKRRKGGKR